MVFCVLYFLNKLFFFKKGPSPFSVGKGTPAEGKGTPPPVVVVVTNMRYERKYCKKGSIVRKVLAYNVGTRGLTEVRYSQE